jgi:DinB superfamily
MRKETMMKRMFVVLALAACCVTGARAQMAQTPPKVPAGTLIEPGKSMDGLLTLYEGQIMSAVNAMPADKYDFAPSAAIFAPSQKVDFVSPKAVNTFGQTVAHVAQANYYFFGISWGAKPDTDVKAIAGMTSKDDTVKALAASFAYAHKQLATMTAANAFASVKDDSTRTSMAAFGIAHMCDHYGQLVEYLRMNGIVPPASAK